MTTHPVGAKRRWCKCDECRERRARLKRAWRARNLAYMRGYERRRWKKRGPIVNAQRRKTSP